MQGKGIIKFFLVFMILICLYQFLLIFPTRSVENNAASYGKDACTSLATGDEKTACIKGAAQSYLDSVSSETVFDMGVISYTYEELKGQQLAFGLDLKGGMSVVLQIDLRDLIVVLSDKADKTDDEFRTALENATKRQANTSTDYVSLFRDEFEKVAPNRKLAELFAFNATLKDEINLSSSNAEVASVIRKQADETVDLTFTRLKQRIDKFGVTQPNVTLDGNTDRIIVELPGVENPERARRFLQASAELEFWDVHEAQEILGAMDRTNEFLRTEAEKQKNRAATQDTTTTDDTDSLSTSEIDTLQADTTKEDSAASQLPSRSLGPLYTLLQVNRGGIYGRTPIGMAKKSDRKKISEMLEKGLAKNFFPKGTRFHWSYKPFKNQDNVYTDDYELYAINTKGKENSDLAGDKVTAASPQVDPQKGEVNVSLTFNREGAKEWGKMTEYAYPTRRSIAIVLDGEVASAPHVQAVMKDGRSSITGNFSSQDAQDLSNILQVGKLPAKTEIIQEAIVGPSLGQKNINSSLISLGIGLGLVLVFMVVYYGGSGVVSIVALLANLFFILGSLASLGTVLTVPGIAGIVLTIGMAVDANVIIYERIREELREGKDMLRAINDGFANSYSAIIDANVTTILTALVLFQYGLGPIKGFAAVLIIGVIASLFTAVLVGRLIIDWWTGKERTLSFSTSVTDSAFANMKIDFVGKRRIAYIVSSTILVLGFISFFTKGFELGVDFKGGYSYAVKFDEPQSIDKVTKVMEKHFEAAPAVKTFGDSRTLEITTSYLINSTEKDADEQVLEKLYAGVEELVGEDKLDGIEKFAGTDSTGVRSDIQLTRSIKIGPTIADDITQSSFYAAIFALLLIFLYILIRFRKWQYSLGAVAALFHDVLIVLSIFSIFYGILPFSLEVDQAFIAAVLTVIGYSINDTVVVFDRIREYMNSYSEQTKKELINGAVNNTISRTIITSLTTLFVVLMLFLFGGGSITGFAFALVIGILVGTYSSVFVATPIVYDLSDELKAKVVQKKKSKYSKKK